jgi:hypothetical protein
MTFSVIHFNSETGKASDVAAFLGKRTDFAVCFRSAAVATFEDHQSRSAMSTDTNKLMIVMYSI